MDEDLVYTITERDLSMIVRGVFTSLVEAKQLIKDGDKEGALREVHASYRRTQRLCRQLRTGEAK